MSLIIQTAGAELHSVSAVRALGDFWVQLGQGTLWRTFARQNPGEVDRLRKYAATGVEQAMRTPTGRALASVVGAQRALDGTPVIPT